MALLAVAANAPAFTIVQIVSYPETTIVEHSTTPPPPEGEPPLPPVPYPITATFQQLDPTIATLNQVTIEYEYDFALVIHIPEFGGGSGGASFQGNFLVNGAMFGGAGTGNGFGGGGPVVFTMPCTAPAMNPPGFYVLDALSNPPAFSQFIGTGTATFLWDAGSVVTWAGSPGGWSDFVMWNTSYIQVTYDYTPVCGAPFADADKDKDVDMDDFAEWQRCFTGVDVPRPATETCYCLDHDQSGIVDKIDLDAFVKCWSGPSVMADTSCTGL